METYNIEAVTGESVKDVAIRVYGQIEGILILVQDNVSVITRYDQVFAGGEILTVRISPDLEKRAITIARKDVALNIIKVIRTGGTICPTLLDLLITTGVGDIKTALDTSGKLVAVIHIISPSDLMGDMTDPQIQYILDNKNSITKRIIYG